VTVRMVTAIQDQPSLPLIQPDSGNFASIGQLQACDKVSKYLSVPISAIYQYAIRGEKAVADTTLRQKLRKLVPHRFETIGGAIWYRYPDLTRRDLAGSTCAAKGGRESCTRRELPGKI
jgi:hypothetical protein